MLIPLALLAPAAAQPCPPRSLAITTDAADGDFVSGPVYEHNRSYTAVRASIRIDGGTIRVPLRATLNGEAGKPVGFDQPPLAATPQP